MRKIRRTYKNVKSRELTIIKITCLFYRGLYAFFWNSELFKRKEKSSYANEVKTILDTKNKFYKIWH